MVSFVFVFPILYFLVKKYNIHGLMICFFYNFIIELCKVCWGQNGYEMFRISQFVLCIGFGCYLWFQKEKENWFFVGAGLSFLFIIATKYYNVDFYIVPWVWRGTSYLASIFLFPIMYYLTRISINNSVIEKLGRASFEIFLVQKIIYGCYKGHVRKIGGVVTGGVISIVICCFGGIMLEFISNIFIKKYNSKIKKLRIYKNFDEFYNKKLKRVK